MSQSISEIRMNSFNKKNSKFDKNKKKTVFYEQDISDDDTQEIITTPATLKKEDLLSQSIPSIELSINTIDELSIKPEKKKSKIIIKKSNKNVNTIQSHKFQLYYENGNTQEELNEMSINHQNELQKEKDEYINPFENISQEIEEKEEIDTKQNEIDIDNVILGFRNLNENNTTTSKILNNINNENKKDEIDIIHKDDVTEKVDSESTEKSESDTEDIINSSNKVGSVYIGTKDEKEINDIDFIVDLNSDRCKELNPSNLKIGYIVKGEESPIYTNIENLFEYSKVYKKDLDRSKKIKSSFFDRRTRGWKTNKTEKNIDSDVNELTPIGFYWKGEVISKKNMRKIYCEKYTNALKSNELFKEIVSMILDGKNIKIVTENMYDEKELKEIYENTNCLFGPEYILYSVLLCDKPWLDVIS